MLGAHRPPSPLTGLEYSQVQLCCSQFLPPEYQNLFAGRHGSLCPLLAQCEPQSGCKTKSWPTFWLHLSGSSPFNYREVFRLRLKRFAEKDHPTGGADNGRQWKCTFATCWLLAHGKFSLLSKLQRLFSSKRSLLCVCQFFLKISKIDRWSPALRRPSAGSSNSILQSEMMKINLHWFRSKM